MRVNLSRAQRKSLTCRVLLSRLLFAGLSSVEKDLLRLLSWTDLRRGGLGELVLQCCLVSARQSGEYVREGRRVVLGSGGLLFGLSRINHD